MGSKFFSAVSNIKGVGEKATQALNRLSISKISDLCVYAPRSIEEIFYHPHKLEPILDKIVILTVKILQKDASFTRNKSTNYSRTKPAVIISFYEPDCAEVKLVFFNSKIANIFVSGKTYSLQGKLTRSLGVWQMTHPTIISADIIQNASNGKLLLNLYPLTYALTNSQIHKYIKQALVILHETHKAELIDLAKLSKEACETELSKLLNILHFPKKHSHNYIDEEIRSNLAFYEMVAHQLSALITKSSISETKETKKVFAEKKLQSKILLDLGFEMTAGQVDALKDIENDLVAGKPMLRMLQGDVGSGKTLVATMALVNFIAQDYQVVIMAPTEILAIQHHKFLEKALNVIGIRPSLLIGACSKKDKDIIYQDISSGVSKIIIGTHAIFQEKVQFKNLKFVIIDEQHRFGVLQRSLLVKKGVNPHLLIMTATPIPRTLSHAIYFNMPISSIYDKPKGRKDIETFVMSNVNINKICIKLRETKDHEKIFWICPLITCAVEEQPGKSDSSQLNKLVSIEERKELLEQYFPQEVQIVHGKMKAAEKLAAYEEFKFGKKRILLATTVVEVGIDVPSATLIMIENAENFGLAALHQLRGRVGRGNKASQCILLHHKYISQNAKIRLQALKSEANGFKISEMDLQIRGAGEFSGYMQSGNSDFKFFNLQQDNKYISAANKLATQIFASGNNNLAYFLNTLFGYDSNIKL